MFPLVCLYVRFSCVGPECIPLCCGVKLAKLRSEAQLRRVCQSCTGQVSTSQTRCLVSLPQCRCIFPQCRSACDWSSTQFLILLVHRFSPSSSFSNLLERTYSWNFCKVLKMILQSWCIFMFYFEL